MPTYRYELSNDGMPSGKKDTVEADYFSIELNESSRLYEYKFYQGGQVKLIIPAHWLIGEPVESNV